MLGRTARIGNEGLATAFFNDKDEALGPFLTKILLETKQDIPEFLQHLAPEDGNLNFEEEEEPDYGDIAEDAGADGGDAWGGGDNAAAPAADTGAAEAWGTNGDAGANCAADAW